MNTKKHKVIWTFLAFLAIFDGLVWSLVFKSGSRDAAELYFLNVGQGDSQLLVLPHNVQILIDGGPANSRAVSELAKILPLSDTYIDAVILTHPQLDHFGGLIDVIKKYQVGAFISTGISGTSKAFQEFAEILKEKGVPQVALAQGDAVSYLDSKFSILNPKPDLTRAKDINDTSLVMLFKSGGLSALFTGDITAKTEFVLAKTFDAGLSAQILKVPHHGSKFSSSKLFLEKVNPKIAVIGVGKNSYGHPTDETLNRLASVGVSVFRTDQDGLVKAAAHDDLLSVFKSKTSY